MTAEDYESLTRRMLVLAEDFDNEHAFHRWFSRNYNVVGFTSVKQDNRSNFPDFVLCRGSQLWRVELEVLASRFIVHRHDPERVDLVICLHKDCSLTVPTLELNPLGRPPEKGHALTVKISDELERKVRDQYIRKKGDIEFFFAEAILHYMKCPRVKKKK
jgi:hypothetical protein